MYFDGGYGTTVRTCMKGQSNFEHPNARIPAVARGTPHEKNTQQDYSVDGAHDQPDASTVLSSSR